MFQNFFGLTDNPFSIAPNPNYLYLSERHQDALAHLSYGLGERGGFVLLTGEVGTGKTTMSRYLLKRLPENTDVALITNPSLSARELLQSICDELKVDYQPEASIKQLTDAISAFMLENNDKGRHTVVIIDEAQHLSAELLEQLRLLTNLETDTRKLLQVILIGQPELQHLLARQELRQLAQRITARYHLLPLNVDELKKYVEHRLTIAGSDIAQEVFSEGAIKVLHQACGGIPRLANLICERAMLAAYSDDTLVVTKQMVQQAQQEVQPSLERPAKQPSNWLFPTLVVSSMVALIVGFYFYRSSINSDLIPPQGHQASIIQAAPWSSPLLETQASLMEQQLTAYKTVFEQWGLVFDVNTTPCEMANKHGFACYRQIGDWQQLLRLNYPAVVRLTENKTNFYGAILASRGSRVLLQLDRQQLWVEQLWLADRLTGQYEFIWKPDEIVYRGVSLNSPQADLQWLEDKLSKLEGSNPSSKIMLDVELEAKIRRFQTNHGLTVDGVADQKTLQQLSLLANDNGPRLQLGQY
ncbi:ExeA family protein [Paraferrimonas sp. SM1919]|uniref:ExeA family protein n=1 Tax=Paraferrimonas sp. SM1919 TaxID=2662263 RepID=UPI0013D18E64|nr:ExeA family protein [Paraferrimonas sp. SM1919]